MKTSSKTQSIAMIGMFTAVLAVLSILQIPMPSGVPITLQTFAVALCGYCLGKKNGTLCVVRLHRWISLWFPVPCIFLRSGKPAEKSCCRRTGWRCGTFDLPCTWCISLFCHCSNRFRTCISAGIRTVSGKRYTVHTGCYAGCRCHPQNTDQRRN